MELRSIERAELTALYENELVFDFPRSELKPLRGMLRLLERGQYEPLVAEENGELLGYAMVWLPPDGNGGLLEYFGVLRGKRSGGLGTQILTLLVERYGQIFGEAELPNSGDAEEDALRRRRLAFYERNGFRILDYQCALFGVHFCCLYRGGQTDDRAVERLHRSVYASYFSPAHMERYIQLPLKSGERVKPAPQWVEEEQEDEEGVRS